jgi:hypothetical protein
LFKRSLGSVEGYQHAYYSAPAEKWEVARQHQAFIHDTLIDVLTYAVAGAQMEPSLGMIVPSRRDPLSAAPHYQRRVKAKRKSYIASSLSADS